MEEKVLPEVKKGNEEEAGSVSTESPFGVVKHEQAVSPETAPEKETGKYQELLQKVAPSQQATSDEGEITLDAKSIGAMTDEESKVQKLLDLAGVKGVAHAVKVARSLKDYYALDRMHDALADKLYQGLLEKGLIQKD